MLRTVALVIQSRDRCYQSSAPVARMSPSSAPQPEKSHDAVFQTVGIKVFASSAGGTY